MRLCSVEGCERIHAARGWCVAHYFRWRNTGDVHAEIPIGRWPNQHQVRYLTTEEIEMVRTDVDRVGTNLAFLGLMWLMTNPESA